MRKVFGFLGEVRVELAKVVWPTRRRATQLTIVVIIVTIFCGAFLAAVDYGLSKGVEYSIDVAQKKNSKTAASPAPVTGADQLPPGALPADQSNPAAIPAQPTQ